MFRHLALAQASNVLVILQPLQQNLTISEPIPCTSLDGIADDAQRAIVAPIVASLEERGYLLLRLEVRKLLQTHLQEAVEHNHVLAETVLDLVKVVLDVIPQILAGLGVDG